MAENNLRLRVILDMVDRVVAPLKRVTTGSGEAARALKAARDRLKELNQQQNQVSEFRALKQGLQDTTDRLGEAQAKVQQLARNYSQAGPPTKAMARDMKAAQREAAALGQQHTTQQAQLQQLRSRLSAAGISTRDLARHERALRGEIASTTAEVQQQTEQLRRNAEQHRRIKSLNEQHAKNMMHTGMIGAAGAGAMMAGGKIASPVRAAIGAFMPAEIAENQLQASVMGADGSLSQRYEEIVTLATRLGDKLPGTTADFIEMMTMLRRQGISEKAILGGLGEASAYLGVQMRMPVTAAAEFGAKMQDATQTAEEDMMSLMDVIQRAYYLGVDPTNMLQGFTKMSAAMPYLGTKGLEASKMLAPLLVMMDQTGMAGESAGNAIRKVVQLSLDRAKVGKANAILKDAGVSLKFSNADGNFAGLDNLFAQLEKLKTVKSAEVRIAALKKLFGDDAETHQVLETLMAKGLDGYAEVVAKMQAQADLRRRVDASLKTVTASAEAAQGSFSNMLKDAGATVAPDLVKVLNALGDVAAGTGAWIRENKEVVKWGMRLVGVLAVLVTAAGALGIAYASIAGPLLIVRFLFARVGFSMFGLRAASAAASGGLSLLSRAWAWIGRAVATVGPWLLRASQWLGAWFTTLGTYLPAVLRVAGVVLRFVTGPVGLLILAGTMLYSRWADVMGGFKLLMADLGSTFMGGLQWVANLATAFYNAGANVLQGLVDGMMGRLAAVREAIGGIADSVAAWFRERLGIASPSKVFMQYGGWVSEGAAIGITAGQDGVRRAALGVATAATLAMPMAAGAGGLQIDGRPPLTAQAMAGGGSFGGSSYQITINAAPGMDEQALARAVSAELDRRERAKRSRVLSTLGDID